MRGLHRAVPFLGVRTEARCWRVAQGEPRLPGPFPPDDELAGTWEALSLDEEGRPLLERRDVWGFPDRPDSDMEPPRNRGIRFG